MCYVRVQLGEPGAARAASEQVELLYHRGRAPARRQRREDAPRQVRFQTLYFYTAGW